MKSMKKKNRIVMLIVLLLIIGIGYASINGKLSIDGIANITKQNWEVYFDNLRVTEGSKTPVHAAVINPQDTTSISYEVYLENPGDFYEFEVDAVNNGSIDAMITGISSTDNGNLISLPSYMTYSVTYDTGIAVAPNQKLAAHSSQTYKVRVEFKQNIDSSELINSQPLNLNLKFDVDYSQATSAAEEVGDIVVTLDPNGGTLTNTTKRVEAGKVYGNLPTPTREGYTFKGWNGKNLLISQFELGSIDNSTGLDEYSSKCLRTIDYIEVESNTTYVISNDMDYANYVYEYNSNKEFINYYGALVNPYTFTTSSNTKYIRVRSVSYQDENDLNAKYQLEEGNIATAYEPYYIKKNTTVVQEQNHTLTAIWEAE